MGEVAKIISKSMSWFVGTGCHSSGCQKVYDKMEETLKATGLDESIKLIQTGCMGACQLGPVVMVYPGEYHYCHVGEDDVRRSSKASKMTN